MLSVPQGVQGLISEELPIRVNEHKEKSKKRKKDKDKVKEV